MLKTIKKKEWLGKSLVLSFLLLVSFFYHRNEIKDYPSYIHTWAQSDRYALALGFTNNGLNIFKPETQIFNKQFPSEWTEISDNTITAVDFPLHDYIPALIMSAFNKKSPGIFRLYILIMSLIGLFFLYKIAFLFSQNFSKSLLITSLAASSPIFLYYQASFLPSIPCLSLSIAGIYFYIKHQENQLTKPFYLAVALLSLSALSRSSFAVPLIALFCVEFLLIIQRKVDFKSRGIAFSLSLISLVSYQIYNAYLRQEYGSNFLSHPMPPENLEDFKNLILESVDNWFLHYFSEWHYYIFLFITLAFTLSLIKNQTSKRKTLLLFLAIYIFGESLFSLLMLRQFPIHDYYFLDTFFLPIIIVFALMVSHIPQPKRTIAQRLTAIMISVTALILPLKAQDILKERKKTGEWDKTQNMVEDYKYAYFFLDEQGIPKDAKILVIDVIAPNLPFTEMRRKGYLVKKFNKEAVIKALEWPYDYICFHFDYFNSPEFLEFPEILEKIEVVASNDKIVLCRKSKNKQQERLENLAVAYQSPALLKDSMNYEDETENKGWENIKKQDSVILSGQQSSVLLPQDVFGVAYKTYLNETCLLQQRKLIVSLDCQTDSINSTLIACSLENKDSTIFYRTIPLTSFTQTKTKDIRHIQAAFKLPIEIEKQELKLAVYLWNIKKETLFYDNFKWAIY